MPFNQFRNREIARKTCLRGFTGRDYVRSVFFAAETLTVNSEGFYNIPIGSFLTKYVYNSEGKEDPTKVKIFEKLGTNANALQTLTLTGEEIEGTFTLEYGGQVTKGIEGNAK